jgi:hypothetical protein
MWWRIGVGLVVTVPVLGYADDAILVSLVLGDTARRAGIGALRRHWPGTAPSRWRGTRSRRLTVR